MKEYLSFEGLSYFFDNLVEKFSLIGHKHTKSEITDYSEFNMTVSDDNSGNVVISFGNE